MVSIPNCTGAHYHTAGDNHPGDGSLKSSRKPILFNNVGQTAPITSMFMSLFVSFLYTPSSILSGFLCMFISRKLTLLLFSTVSSNFSLVSISLNHCVIFSSVLRFGFRSMCN